MWAADLAAVCRAELGGMDPDSVSMAALGHMIAQVCRRKGADVRRRDNRAQFDRWIEVRDRRALAICSEVLAKWPAKN